MRKDLTKISEAKRRIQDIIAEFEVAHRFGPDDDEPEGVRHVRISDTLVMDLITALKELL